MACFLRVSPSFTDPPKYMYNIYIYIYINTHTHTKKTDAPIGPSLPNWSRLFFPRRDAEAQLLVPGFKSAPELWAADCAGWEERLEGLARRCLRARLRGGFLVSGVPGEGEGGRDRGGGIGGEGGSSAGVRPQKEFGLGGMLLKERAFREGLAAIHSPTGY